MKSKALLVGGILLILVAFAGLYFGYRLNDTAPAGEGPNVTWMWTSFSFQLLAGTCFIWQHSSIRRHEQKAPAGK